MRTQLVPKDFTVPIMSQVSDRFYVVPITTKNTNEDLKALLSSAEIISKVRGMDHLNKTDWPYVVTYEENYIDLAWLEVCHQRRQLFSYILRDVRDDTYAGCIYIYPIELFYPEKAKSFDVDFTFWITKKYFDDGLYDSIYFDLQKWLEASFPFEKQRIFYRNKLKPKGVV